MLKAKEKFVKSGLQYNPCYAQNWAKLPVDGGDSKHVLMFRGAPIAADGTMYPPIEWATVGRASDAAQPMHRIPQVWTHGDTPRLLGCIWEIVVRYENGDYDFLNPEVYRAGESQSVTDSRAKRHDAIKALVCEVHAHLGTELYAEFSRL